MRNKESSINDIVRNNVIKLKWLMLLNTQQIFPFVFFHTVITVTFHVFIVICKLTKMNLIMLQKIEKLNFVREKHSANTNTRLERWIKITANLITTVYGSSEKWNHRTILNIVMLLLIKFTVNTTQTPTFTVTINALFFVLHRLYCDYALYLILNGFRNSYSNYVSLFIIQSNL